MTVTYIQVVLLITLENLFPRLYSLGLKLLFTWIGLVGIVVVIHIIRLLYWMVKKLIYMSRLLHWIMKKLIHIILQLIYWMLKMCNFTYKLTRSTEEGRANV
jgi:hypothetical protein